MLWHEKVLAFALGASAVGHLISVGVPVAVCRWGVKCEGGKPAKLIYHKETVPAASEWTQQQPVPAQAQIRELARSMSATLPGPASRVSVGSRDRAAALGAPNPDRASGAGAAGWGTVPGGAGGAGGAGRDVWATAVDLTDLAAAAQGNPVLFSYFGAIRERIQQTADGRPWLPEHETGSGVVYIGFVISRTGALQSSAIMPERSTAPPQLCDIALQIVRASNPFLPLPPSFTESSKAVVVPIEFAAR